MGCMVAKETRGKSSEIMGEKRESLRVEIERNVWNDPFLKGLGFRV